MKFLRYSLLYVMPMALLAVPSSAQLTQQPTRISAVGQDPSNLYLEAWFAMQDAEKLAVKNDFTNAIKKCQQAEQLMAAISNDHPDWKKNMVSLRRQSNNQNIEKWVKAARENPDRQLGGNAAALVERTPGQAVQTPEATPRPNIPSFDELDARRQANRPQPQINPAPAAEFPSQIAPQNAFEQLEADRLKLTFENKALVKALKDTRKQLVDALAEKVNAEAGVTVYREKYEELKAQMEQDRAADDRLLKTLTQRYNQIEEELKLANARNKEAAEKIARLENLLTETNSQLAKVTKERDDLQIQYDQLAAIAEFNSPEKTKAVLDNNLTLASQLKDAQDKIAQLESEKSGDEDQKAVNLRELEKTRAEATQTKILLAALRDENIGYRRRISELNTKLVNAEAEIERLSRQPNADPIAIEENKILKATITKQMRALATQQQGRELLIAAYKKQNLNNPEIDEALSLLEDESKLELTPIEQEIAKTFTTIPAAEGNLAGNSTATYENISETVRKQLEIEALGRSAKSSFDIKHYAAAEQLYRTLLEIQPEHFAARANLGFILVNRGQVQEAIEHLKRANEIAPQNARVWHILGIANFRKGVDKDAIAAFQQTISLEPDNAEAYLYMGIIESAAGNTSQSVAHFDNALRISPDMARAHFNKAWALANAGKITQARESYDLAIQHGETPDFDLQRILDPKGSTLPLRPAPALADNQADSSSPAPEIELVDNKPQQEEIKDATAVPAEPIAKQTPNVQLVKHTTEPPAEQLIEKVPHATPQKTTVKEASASPAAPQNAPKAIQKAAPQEEAKPLPPKNRRRFRFG